MTPFVVLIPSYNPSKKFLNLVRELLVHKGCEIIVVNDGSHPDSSLLFDELALLPNLVVLHHPKNFGKGQAIKTGIEYILENAKFADRIITADCDGQHSPKDIIKMAHTPFDLARSLLLGFRAFELGKVPFRSWLGNVIMRGIFFLTYGVFLKDTQTGLRVFSPHIGRKFLDLTSQRYEFEMDMLILCRRNSVSFVETPIETIYEDKNRASHFNPIMDSLRVSFTLFRFIIVSLITAAIDMIVFFTLCKSGVGIVGSFLSARMCAGIFNFYFNRTIVFKQEKFKWILLAKYIALVLTALGFAFFLAQELMIHLKLNIFAAKVIAEGIVFIFSFLLQRFFIFKKEGRP